MLQNVVKFSVTFFLSLILFITFHPYFKCISVTGASQLGGARLPDHLPRLAVHAALALDAEQRHRLGDVPGDGGHQPRVHAGDGELAGDDGHHGVYLLGTQLLRPRAAAEHQVDGIDQP